jgi:two-component system, sensor histidine kinase
MTNTSASVAGNLLTDSQLIVESLPGEFLVLDPAPAYFTIIAASNGFLRTTELEKGTLIGKSVFDIYPNFAQGNLPTPGFSHLHESLQKVLQSKKPHQILLFRYFAPTDAGNREERSCAVTHTPVLNKEGEVRYILHARQEITNRPKAAEKKQAQLKVEKIQEIFLQAPVGMAILTGSDAIIELANKEILNMWDKTSDLVGRPFFQVIPEAKEQGIPAILEQVQKTGQPFYSSEFPLTIVKNGEKIMCYYCLLIQPYHGEKGSEEPTGLLWFSHEVTEQVMARQKIEVGANELNSLANAMPQIVWIADANGNVTYYNDRVSEFAGAIKLADGTWSWQGILIPEDEQPTVQAWSKAVAEGTNYEKEHRLKMHNGMYRWHLSRAFPQKDEAGTIKKWYGTATDVHQQKTTEEALRQSEEQLRIALEGAELGTFTYFPQSGNHFWSAKTKELLGILPTAEETFEHHFNAMHPDDKVRSYELVQKALQPENGGSYENEFRIIDLKKGSIRWIRSKGKVSFNNNGQPIRLTGIMHDITKRKQAEESLELKNAQLLRINTDLDNFVYTASHDLKAPIANIEGLINLLSSELSAGSVPEGEVQHMLGLMQNAAQRFKKTIASLTDIIKLQHDSILEVTTVNLLTVVEEVLLDLEQLVQVSGARIEVTLKADTHIFFSQKNLRSIIFNLLSNALKYRSTDRLPLVQVTCQEEPGYIVLVVQDNGTGLNEKQLGQLYTMFRRFHDHVEGTGIGLYMIKKMVENAGGHIEVKSLLGQGSTFRVFFRNGETPPAKNLPEL